MANITYTYNAGTADAYAKNDNVLKDDSQHPFGGTGTTGEDPRSWIPFTIPFAQGKTIVSATLSVVSISNEGLSECDIIVGCEAADNSANPANGTALRAKPMTTANSTLTQGATSTGNTYTFDCTAAVQEVLNRAGWVTNNTLGVLVWDSIQGNNHRRLYASADNGTYTGPQLLITVIAFIPHSESMY